MHAASPGPRLHGRYEKMQTDQPRLRLGGAGLRFAIAIAFIFLVAQGAAAKTVFVTPTGSGPGYAADGSVVAEQTQAFSSLTMRAVLPGDTVQLLLDSPDP